MLDQIVAHSPATGASAIKTMRRQIGLEQNLVHEAGQIGVRELKCRNIDGDLIGWFPRGGILAGTAQHWRMPPTKGLFCPPHKP